MKDAIAKAYVRYGMHVFEHEHAKKERIRENQADEAELEQAQGGSRKKCRREEERRTMTLGVNSGVTADDEFGFSDEEVAVVSVEEGMERADEDLEGAQVARGAELRKEAVLTFTEYRNYNRIELTTNRGWDQYLAKAQSAQSVAPLVPAAPVAPADVAVTAGQQGQSTAAVFFDPRSSVTAAPGAVAAALPPTEVALNEPPAVQYDLMAYLLDADRFKVYSDMLRSDSLRIQKRKSAKFGYLPMMAVATLGALNAESFCERVLSCVKLVVSDLHVSLKAEEIRMLVMLRMNREFMEYMGGATYPDTPLSEFKAADTYVRARGGVEALDDDEDDEEVVEIRKKISRSER